MFAGRNGTLARSMHQPDACLLSEKRLKHYGPSYRTKGLMFRGCRHRNNYRLDMFLKSLHGQYPHTAHTHSREVQILIRCLGGTFLLFVVEVFGTSSRSRVQTGLLRVDIITKITRV